MPKTVAPTAEFSLSWQGFGLRAEEVDIPWGKSASRTVRRVQLTVADTLVQLHPGELKDLISGRVALIESMGVEQLGFLAVVGKIPNGSDAAAITASLPAEAPVLLMEPVTQPPAAVLTGDDLAGFTSWVKKLP